MKKLIPLLLTGLFACWSCDLKDTYTQTNVQDLVTVVGDQLVNDNGYALNVVEDAVGANKWKVEGARYYALFDILNRALDIRLKDVLRANIVEIMDDYTPEEYAKDPVEFSMQGLSGGYINLGFNITKNPASNNAHVFRFHYKNEQEHLTIYVEHEGNGEDPVHMPDAELATEGRVYCIPVKDLPSFSLITLVMNVITTNSEGQKVIQEDQVNLRAY